MEHAVSRREKRRIEELPLGLAHTQCNMGPVGPRLHRVRALTDTVVQGERLAGAVRLEQQLQVGDVDDRDCCVQRRDRVVTLVDLDAFEVLHGLGVGDAPYIGVVLVRGPASVLPDPVVNDLCLGPGEPVAGCQTSPGLLVPGDLIGLPAIGLELLEIALGLGASLPLVFHLSQRVGVQAHQRGIPTHIPQTVEQCSRGVHLRDRLTREQGCALLQPFHRDDAVDSHIRQIPLRLRVLLSVSAVPSHQVHSRVRSGRGDARELQPHHTGLSGVLIHPMNREVWLQDRAYRLTEPRLGQRGELVLQPLVKVYAQRITLRQPVEGIGEQFRHPPAVDLRSGLPGVGDTCRGEHMFHLAALVHQIGDDRLCDPSRLRLDRGVLQRRGEVGHFDRNTGEVNTGQHIPEGGVDGALLDETVHCFDAKLRQHLVQVAQEVIHLGRSGAILQQHLSHIRPEVDPEKLECRVVALQHVLVVRFAIRARNVDLTERDHPFDDRRQLELEVLRQSSRNHLEPGVFDLQLVSNRRHRGVLR